MATVTYLSHAFPAATHGGDVPSPVVDVTELRHYWTAGVPGSKAAEFVEATKG